MPCSLGPACSGSIGSTGSPASRSATSVSVPASWSMSTSRSSAGSPTAGAGTGSVARRAPRIQRRHGAGLRLSSTSAVDDTSPVAYVARPRRTSAATTCARFLHRRRRVLRRARHRPHRAGPDRQRQELRPSRGVRKRPRRASAPGTSVTRPYRPQTNGKAERFNRHPAHRMGLRPPLRHQPGAARRPPGLDLGRSSSPSSAPALLPASAGQPPSPPAVHTSLELHPAR